MAASLPICASSKRLWKWPKKVWSASVNLPRLWPTSMVNVAALTVIAVAVMVSGATMETAGVMAVAVDMVNAMSGKAKK